MALAALIRPCRSARSATTLPGEFPEWSILYCRGAFVVHSARVIAEPS